MENMLERFGMKDCRPASTPMVLNLKLPKLTEAEVDTKAYQSRVGSLMYPMLLTRPDIAFPVVALSQHCLAPGKEHWAALNRVFQYLRKTANTSLVFRGDSVDLLGYVDADWANDTNDRRSISGFVYILSGGAISWSSQKQRIVAQSSTEAEYIAGASATNEAIWLRALLREIGHIQQKATILLTDNQASIAIAKNPVHHKRTKHIDVRYHHMRHCFETDQIDPIYIPTSEQVADVLTKPLSWDKHEKFMRGMGLVLGNSLTS
jgi:hypothetical protein